MQTLRFTYTTDSDSTFHLELTSEDERLTGSDLILMGKYIRLLFATIRKISEINSSPDIDSLIDDLMRGDDA